MKRSEADAISSLEDTQAERFNAQSLAGLKGWQLRNLRTKQAAKLKATVEGMVDDEDVPDEPQPDPLPTNVKAEATSPTTAVLTWTPVAGKIHEVGRDPFAGQSAAWSQQVPSTTGMQAFTLLAPGVPVTLWVRVVGGERVAVTVTPPAVQPPVDPPVEPPAPPAGDVVTLTVDLGVKTQATDVYALGVCSSGYGRTPVASAEQAKWERQLDARFWRAPIRLSDDGSKVINSAAGGGGHDAKPIIDLYRSWGHRVLAVCAGRGDDDWGSYQTGDYGRIRQILGTDQVEFTGPNEVGLRGKSIDDFLARALQMQNETGAPVGGPVWTHYDLDVIRRSSALRGTRDWHEYAMGEKYIPPAQALAATPQWGQHIREVKATGFAGQPTIDELNYSWRYDIPGHGPVQEFFTAVNVVWMASALGHILAAGGRGMPYATQNGALGVTVEKGPGPENPDGRPLSSPMPAFWGIAAWTGAQLFPHYKDQFYRATSPDPLVEVFAVSNEAGGHNIVVINKHPAPKAVSLAGVAGGQRWTTDPAKPYDAPTKASAGASWTQPGYSYSVIVTGTTPPVVPPVVDTEIPAAPAGWARQLTERFDVPVSTGGWYQSVYAKENGGNWFAYQEGWDDTARKGNPAQGGTYSPNRCLSVHDGMLDVRCFVDGDGPHSGTIATSGAYTSARVTVRAQADRSGKWKTAWLFWPTSDTWPRDGEIDFPEGNLGDPVAGFVHHMNGTAANDQTGRGPVAGLEPGVWHDFTIEWVSGTSVRFLRDGQPVGDPVTARVPSTPMGWVLQIESAMDGSVPAPGDEAHVRVAWITIDVPA